MAFSLMNGISTMGAGVAQFAASAGLEAQKFQLANEAAILADQLATTRETTLQKGQQTFISGENTQNRAAAAANLAATEEAAMARARVSESGATGRTMATIAAENQRQQNLLNAPVPEIKSAQQFQKLTPEEKQAFREETATKAGLPAWMIGGSDAPSSPTGSGAVPDITNVKPDGTIKESGVSDSTRNEGALSAIPPAAASIIKGMVDGRISPPSSFALSKPYWQGLIAKAAEYDPTFDQTTWAGRVAARKDMAVGRSAQAVTAMNTALGHAGTLLTDFDALGNYGGIATPLNAPLNAAARAFGSSKQTKAEQTVDALASEARKVFAASGGGNLTELQEWQKNFPLNGSPAQQKAALTGFVDLLDGRLQAIADQNNRAMGRADDPVALLNQHAREVYEKLTGREPKSSTVYQSGKPPTPVGDQGLVRTPDGRVSTPNAGGLGIPPWVKPGDQYSPSRGQARSADGTVYGPPQ